MPLTDPNRLFPTDPATRHIAQGLYDQIKDMRIISPHGHCDPAWFAKNDRFPDPAQLFVVPDHYVFRMLVSQGVSMDALGIPDANGQALARDPRDIWRLFAQHFHLFAGTPSAMWLNHSFEHVFGLDVPLNAGTADAYYDHIDAALGRDDFRPRALFDRFGIEVLATTEGALDNLKYHAQIAASGWAGRVVTTYRPDQIIDPEFEGFVQNIDSLCTLTGLDATTWEGYLAAHRQRRAVFKAHGATASDHGHPSARTECLTQTQAAALFDKALHQTCTADEADAFRGHMLTEMARMSLEDGLVLQIHAGSYRNHSGPVFQKYGRDKGFDIPTRTDFVHALKPLLDEVGMEPDMRIILFTLDETAFARELAPLAGAYPALRLGPPWWFHDSYEGMMRFRQTTTETCGFYNTAGFNDDTRAFCSIPARHDVARRVDCAYLAELVATGRLGLDEASTLAPELTYGLAKHAYNL